MKFRSLLYSTPIALTLGWGCTVNQADLGSNGAGNAGTSAGDAGSSGSQAAGATGGTAGSDTNPGSGGTSNGGNGAQAGTGATDGGSDGEPGGSTGNPGGTGGDAGGGGNPQCACPYPPVLGGDCCTAEDACETDGVACDELRRSIQALRGWDDGDAGDDERQAADECKQAISEALIERCAFVSPECGEPVEDYATFGDHEDEAYSECTTEETSRELNCGEPGSYYAPSCCQRKRCQDDGVCPDGRCIYRLVQSPEQNPGAPHAEQCQLMPQGCACGWIEAGEQGSAYCIGDDEDIERFDCDAQSRTCEELAEWRDRLDTELELHEPTPEATSAYEACGAKISVELEERCTGCRETGCEEGKDCVPCRGMERVEWICLPDGSVC